MENRPIILLIDDDAAIRRLCSRMLQRLGFDLVEAETGAKGLALATEHNESLSAILLDMNLPDGPGQNVARKISELPEPPPVIFFTGTATTEQTVDENGQAHYFLKKPFTKASLEDVLRKVEVPIPTAST